MKNNYTQTWMNLQNIILNKRNLNEYILYVSTYIEMGISVVSGLGYWLKSGKGEHYEMMEMFCIFIWMMVTWVYIENVNVRSVHFPVYKLLKITCK